MCWADEDHIGEISRCSRRVHGFNMTIVYQTLRKSLIAYKRQWNATARSLGLEI